MFGPRHGFVLLLVAGVAAAHLCAAELVVDNPVGGITARVVDADSVHVKSTSPDREVRSTDIKVSQAPGIAHVVVQPADGVRIDVEVDIPYGYELRARTADGPLSVEGLVRRAELITGTGEVRLAAPWEATRLTFHSARKPPEVTLPHGVDFDEPRRHGKEDAGWTLNDSLPDLKVTYGRILVEADAPRRLVLERHDIPDESPVKLPWQAPAVIDQILARKNAAPPERPPAPGLEPAPADEPPFEEGLPRFSSDVRMVNLTVAVFDEEGRPITDLTGDDFTVVEDGVPQKVSFAGSEEVPFNLVLLLDLSGSTRRDLDAMQEAARRFLEIARPTDRVALYTLASDVLQVASPLTLDHDHLKEIIDNIPEVSGGTPLYDIIALAYAQELRDRPTERNAIIVLSDGDDNRIHGIGTPSETSIKDLLKAADRMHTLIYPVFLDPFTVAPPPGWAKKERRNLEELAMATGGRLFPAQSIRDLDPVYPLVADELRSLYTVNYYPSNQRFDGEWRKVEVRVERPGAQVRARNGYYGR